MSKACRLTSCSSTALNSISVIKRRYFKKRQKRLQQREKKRAVVVEAETKSRIHPIYLEYTPRDIAEMTDRALLNDLFERYTPMSQSFWEEEADYLFRMMYAISNRLDELDNLVVYVENVL